jgi:hypothetical protein
MGIGYFGEAVDDADGMPFNRWVETTVEEVKALISASFT